MMRFVASFLLVLICGAMLMNQSIGFSVAKNRLVRPLAIKSPSTNYYPHCGRLDSRPRSMMYVKAKSDDSDETPSVSGRDDEMSLEINAENTPSESYAEDFEKASSTFRARLKKLWVKDKDDGLTTRQRLAKMGLAAVLSYGWVSNVSYAICVSIAWYGFSKKTGLSPLAPDQWKPFLAVYAGFFVFNNVVRPLRLGLSVAISQYFDKVIAFVERKTKFSRSIAVALVVFVFNIVGTISLMALGISLASMVSGVPIFPPKVLK